MRSPRSCTYPLTRQGINDVVGQYTWGLTLHTTNNDVGAKHSGDNIRIQSRFFYPNASPFPSAARAKHLETETKDYPIDSRPNASPLQNIWAMGISPHQLANNILEFRVDFVIY